MSYVSTPWVAHFDKLIKYFIFSHSYNYFFTMVGRHICTFNKGLPGSKVKLRVHSIRRRKRGAKINEDLLDVI